MIMFKKIIRSLCVGDPQNSQLDPVSFKELCTISTAQKKCTRKNFFFRPQEVFLAADCGSLELESWKPQELLCGCMIKAQELLCGSLRDTLKGTRQGTHN